MSNEEVLENLLYEIGVSAEEIGRDQPPPDPAYSEYIANTEEDERSEGEAPSREN